jgi:hypothetical protein
LVTVVEEGCGVLSPPLPLHAITRTAAARIRKRFMGTSLAFDAYLASRR